MLLRNNKVKTEFGEIITTVAHCDYCGKKHLVSNDMKGGAMDWLEVRRFDRDVPPIHFCNLEHLTNGIQKFERSGITKIEHVQWNRIFDLCSSANGEG